MPIFGQVWLWSLLAFLLGALVLYLLMVLPVRRRIDELERRLSALRTDSKPYPERRVPAADAEPPVVPGFGDRDVADEIRSESLTRAYALPNAPDSPYAQPETPDPEERGALRLSPEDAPARDATAYLGSLGAPLMPTEPPAGGRDWFDEVATSDPAAPEPRGEHRLVDDEDDEDERGTIFTQRTTPIPAEVIRQLDEAGRADAPQPDDSLVDDLDDEQVEEEPAEQPVGRHEPRTQFVEPERESEPEPEPAHSNGLTQAEERHGLPEAEPMPMPPTTHRSEERISLLSQAAQRSPIAELTTQAKLAQSPAVEAERTQNALPKRIPAKPQHRHPFGVQTVSPATTTGSSERTRSLFEPVIPADGGDSGELPPPPHRLRSADSRPSAPGPFGPGSAMPLPGGASPSPEFTIKASVTALRYCTPESPQFGRTVAEVWFRSAADAERVGFRPVG
jgi:hypothetical protein